MTENTDTKKIGIGEMKILTDKEVGTERCKGQTNEEDRYDSLSYTPRTPIKPLYMNIKSPPLIQGRNKTNDVKIPTFIPASCSLLIFPLTKDFYYTNRIGNLVDSWSEDSQQSDAFQYKPTEMNKATSSDESDIIPLKTTTLQSRDFAGISSAVNRKPPFGAKKSFNASSA